jgi:hypothetical protein
MRYHHMCSGAYAPYAWFLDAIALHAYRLTTQTVTCQCEKMAWSAYIRARILGSNAYAIVTTMNEQSSERSCCLS